MYLIIVTIVIESWTSTFYAKLSKMVNIVIRQKCANPSLDAANSLQRSENRKKAVYKQRGIQGYHYFVKHNVFCLRLATDCQDFFCQRLEIMSQWIGHWYERPRREKFINRVSPLRHATLMHRMSFIILPFLWISVLLMNWKVLYDVLFHVLALWNFIWKSFNWIFWEYSYLESRPVKTFCYWCWKFVPYISFIWRARYQQGPQEGIFILVRLL